MKGVRKYKRHHFALMLLLLLSSPPVAAESLKNENLLTSLPDGFKVGFQAQKEQTQIAEYVPATETVDNWSKMITVQIFHRAVNVTPNAFADRIATQWKSACAGGEVAKNREGLEAGYSFSIWMFLCPLNPQTKKPENMWLKVIRGNDSLYSIQYAYRAQLTIDMIGPSMDYLRKVTVCDTRLADRPCPSGM